MKRHFLIGAVVVSLFSSSLLGAEMNLVPARANMPYSIAGNEITVPAGARVELDVFVSDWGPALVAGCGAAMKRDGSGFSGGTDGSLSFYRPLCTPGNMCEGPLGESPMCYDGDRCAPNFVAHSRSDFLFLGNWLVAIGGGSTDGVFWAIGAVYSTSYVNDIGTSKYVGTFIVELSPDASGTFTISLDPDPGWTVLLDDAVEPILPLNLGSALITVGTPPPCSPDADGDGIQTSVDPNDGFPSDTFVDTSTSPSTTGSYLERGDQDLCASDEPAPQGVRVESLSGGANPATVQLTCFGNPSDIETRDLTSGECVICTCLSGPTAQVGWCPGSPASVGSAGPASVALPVREVELDLLRSGLVVATVVLPEGNTITYDPQTAEVTAPTSNNTTLNLVGRSGGQQSLAPGQTTTVPDSAIPAASVWGLAVLVLALLVGAKVFFSRRRAAA